jgi:hypothetical protein
LRLDGEGEGGLFEVPVTAGSCSITASQAGNTNFNAATSVSETFAIGKADQTIGFTNPGGQTFSSGGTVDLTGAATASSGLAVTYASTTPGVCTVSGSTVTMVRAHRTIALSVRDRLPARCAADFRDG